MGGVSTDRPRLTVSCLVALTAMCGYLPIYAQVGQFDIPSEKGSKSIPELAQQAGVQILAPGAPLQSIITPEIKGTFDVDVALEMMLKGTDLVVSRTAEGVITISSRQKNCKGETMSPNPRNSASVLALILAALTAPACIAQSAPAADDSMETVVVTGTLLRGIAPVGTHVVTLSTDQIEAIGATGTNQILTKIPQVTSSFNRSPTLPSYDPGNSIISTNIRSIPAGGATTLMLLDGHRVGGTGGFANTDADVVPSNVIERVDVMPDGGSSIYGSDAVGGVINLITRKHFDGFKADITGGVADAYHSMDLSFLAGKDWGSGSAYMSYSYNEAAELRGSERGYWHQVTPNNAGCAPGTVSINRAGTITNYALPGLVPGTTSSCDATDNFTIYPGQARHSIFGRITQQVSPSVEVGLTAFYTRRDTTSHFDANQSGNSQSVTITPSNPYYVPIAPDTGTQTVQFSYANIWSTKRTTLAEQWNVTGTVTADLGSGWQLRALGTYGRSAVNMNSPIVDTSAQATAIAGTTTATALNPYNPAATNPAVLRSILTAEVTSQQRPMGNARVIVDGSPLSLPGGDVRLAVGVEYAYEQLHSVFVGTSFLNNLTADRNVKSIFGEVAVPIVGNANAVPFVEALTVSASGRYDDYSDVGHTFNPKLGITWNPIDWITVRGNWGTSFNAPNLGDTGAAADTRSVLIPVVPVVFADPADVAAWSLNPVVFAQQTARPTAIIAGGNPGLKPQTARTWSYGAEVKPPILPGLSLSATFYHISMSKLITIVPIFNPAQAYLPTFSPWVVKNPTLAQANAMMAGISALVGFPSIAAWYNSDPGYTPYVILDARRQNLAAFRQEGLDFAVNYVRDTDFGSLNAGFSGTWTTQRDFQGSPIASFAKQLYSPGLSRLQFLTSVGAKVGEHFNGTVYWSHSAGFDLHPNVGGQKSVDSFDTVDLSMAYDFTGTELFGSEKAGNDLRLALNMNNVFDANPPFYNTDPGVLLNVGTLGRFVQLSLSKKF